MFPEYYRPEKEDFDRIWGESLFVLDANVLLNLYRYSEQTRQALLDILREVQDKLWLPHQAAAEYLSQRLEVIHQQRKEYKEFRDRLGEIQKDIEERTEGLHRDSVSEAEDHMEEVRDSLAGLADYLREKEDGFAKESNAPKEDAVWREVEEIFTGRIGAACSEERKKEIVDTEGPERYDNQVPPGYKDEKKGGARQFGDLVLWFQILDKAKEAKRPILLVTDDRKEDWWWKSHSKTIGPRRELVKELGREADVSFYMYQPFRFMEEAGRVLSLSVSDEAINEARELASIEDEERQAEELVRHAAAAGQAILAGSDTQGADESSQGRYSASYGASVRPDPELREGAKHPILSREALVAAEQLRGLEDQEVAKRLSGLEGQEVLRLLGDPEVQRSFKRLFGV